MTAKGLLDDKGVSLIQGHTHRMGMYYKTIMGRKILTAVEGGCLCSFDTTYVNNPNWQHGFTLIQYHKKDYSIYPIKINRGKIIWNNKVYSV